MARNDGLPSFETQTFALRTKVAAPQDEDREL
jgi:hypothetical protein